MVSHMPTTSHRGILVLLFMTTDCSWLSWLSHQRFSQEQAATLSNDKPPLNTLDTPMNKPQHLGLDTFFFVEYSSPWSPILASSASGVVADCLGRKLMTCIWSLYFMASMCVRADGLVLGVNVG